MTNFKGIQATNEIESKLLDQAREELSTLMAEIETEGDLAILIADYASDGEALLEEVYRMHVDVRDYVEAAADPGRSGYSLDDISFSLTQVREKASEEFEKALNGLGRWYVDDNGEREFFDSGYEAMDSLKEGQEAGDWSDTAHVDWMLENTRNFT